MIDRIETPSGTEQAIERPELTTHRLLSLYATMQLIRECEERLADLLIAGEVRCPTHLCTGQEAIAAGVCAAPGSEDYIFGGHRSHGHYLAKGGDLSALMAELYGKESGCSGGRGGSMHLVAPEVGLLGTAPIVAATIPLAVGTALASSMRDDGRVSVAFFGDGAAEEGAFHESMNLAASMCLPVIFVCENNFYSSHLQLLERRARDNIVQSAEAYGMAGSVVDGNDVIAVHDAARGAVARAKAGKGPVLLECRTFRWRGHVGPAFDLDVGVTRRDELEAWRSKDPIMRLGQVLEERGVPPADLEGLRAKAQGDVCDAINYARSAAYPAREELGRFVFRSRGGTD